MPVHTHTYPNGLTLLVEPIADVESAGLTLLLPAGAATEPADRRGAGSVLTEWLFRGAGDRDARAHSEALDQLGVKRDSSTSAHHQRLGATMLGDRLHDALPLILDMALRPQLPDDAFGPCRDLAIQAIDGLEDEPQRKVMLELRGAHLPEPLNRSPLGRREHLQNMTADDVRSFVQARYVPGRAILGLAGKVDPDSLVERIGELIDGWTGAADEVEPGDTPERGHHHVRADSTQQHIGLAYDAVPETDPNAMTQRIGIAALSGGMSARLFTEIREKRGLCYAVHAAYQTIMPRGVVGAYAGTTVDRAEETLQVLEHEMRRLSDGIDDDEFQRAVAGLKSRLVIQGESTSARAAAIAGDQFILGRPRTLDELEAEIDNVTLTALNDFLASHRPETFTTVNIGPKPLTQG